MAAGRQWSSSEDQIFASVSNVSATWLTWELVAVEWRGPNTAMVAIQQQSGVKLFTTYVPGFWSVKDAN